MTQTGPKREQNLKPGPDRSDAFRLLFFCVLAVGAGNQMLIAAVLPPLTRTLELPDWTAGAIFSLSAAAWTVTSPIWGRLSNRWGRRPVIVIGLAGFATSMLLFGITAQLAMSGIITGLWPVFICLLLSRSLFGLFGSGTPPASQAYIADRTAPVERTDALAGLTSGFTFGSVAGPAVAAALVTGFGLLSPVVLAALGALVMAVLVWTKLPETAPPQAQVTAVQDEFGRKLWRSAAVFPFLTYGAGLSLITGVLVQTFPFALMDKLDVAYITAAQYTGPAMAMGAMATLLAQLVFIPRLKMTPKPLMVWGAVSLFVGAALIMIATDFATLVVGQMAMGLGSGFARAGFTAGASLAVDHRYQGNVAGLVVSANGIGFIISPFFGLWLYQHAHPAAPFLFCMGVLALLMVQARWRLPRLSI